MKGFRQSKFRHTFGKPLKREESYDNIRITKSSWDSTFVAVNPKYLAVILESGGGGAFLVLPLGQTGRLAPDYPLVYAHTGPVLDLAWCPFNDDLIASASDDCTIKIWEIPEGGLKTDLKDAVVTLEGHQKRVALIRWHPVASDILLSAGWDMSMILWDVSSSVALVECQLPDLPLSASFNSNGSRLALTAKDKFLRVFDARTMDVITEGKSHDGAKSSFCVYTTTGAIFTTGFSKTSERQYALWDENDLSKPITMQELDTSNGVLFPFYDPDTNMVYLCGKGDTTIRYFEITDEAPFVHFLNMHQSADPQRGIGFMPKRGVDVNICEIARFYKILANGSCQVLPMIVPRKSDLFQDDLYPDTIGDTPALTGTEWFQEKKDANPIMISLREGCKPSRRALGKMGVKADGAQPTVVKKTVVAAPATPATPASPVVKLPPEMADLRSSLEHAVDRHIADAKSGSRPLAADSKPMRPPAAPHHEPQPDVAPPRQPLATAQHAHAPASATAQAVSAAADVAPPKSTPTTETKRASTTENGVSCALDDDDEKATTGGADVEAMTSDIRKLKIIVKGQERRIRELEERLKRVEAAQEATLSDYDDHKGSDEPI